MSKQQYNKPPLTISQQIEKLRSRGMAIEDDKEAAKYLTAVSYYRLRTYSSPYQNNEPDSSHCFTREGITLNQLIELYNFDRKLRSLLFSELERIEVALRTTLSQVYAEQNGNGHWYLNKELFDKKYFHLQTYTDSMTNREVEYCKFDNLIADFRKDVRRSNEEFIKQYLNKYDDPELPPSWMSLEVVSFGTLSKLYLMLESSEAKLSVAKRFGILREDIFINWLHAFSELRNCCAHHNRVWNRRFMQIKLSYNTQRPFMSKEDIRTIRQNKLFAVVSAMKYMVDAIYPENDFAERFKVLLQEPVVLRTYEEMGFPKGWQVLPIWR
ncbi:MAG: Abi family protein [Paludibacteraceae bacterium]|nr:Abi family protein [Paludibacteraceae bacterium]